MDALLNVFFMNDVFNKYRDGTELRASYCYINGLKRKLFSDSGFKYVPIYLFRDLKYFLLYQIGWLVSKSIAYKYYIFVDKEKAN